MPEEAARAKMKLDSASEDVEIALRRVEGSAAGSKPLLREKLVEALRGLEIAKEALQ